MRRPRWLTRRRPSAAERVACPESPECRECPDCGAVVHETYCEVCGYDLVRKVQDEVSSHRPTF